MRLEQATVMPLRHCLRIEDLKALGATRTGGAIDI